MGVFNAGKRFRESIRLSGFKRNPNSVRDWLSIKEVYEDGIFLVDDSGETNLYDRVYLFSDINYINKNQEEKVIILNQLVKWLNGMKVNFKITLANEYRDTKEYLSSICETPMGKNYPAIDQGMKEWIHEKTQDEETGDQWSGNKSIYLTVSVTASEKKDAAAFLHDLDGQLMMIFAAFGSTLRILDGKERLAVLLNFFHPGYSPETIRFDTVHDPLSSVLPVSIEVPGKDYLKLGDTYASVLFLNATQSSRLNEEKVLHELSLLPCVSWLSLDISPVASGLFRDMLSAAGMNSERAISQEMESKQKRGMAYARASYARERKLDELEEMQDQVDDNNEECFNVTLLFVVTAQTEEELSNRIRSAKNIGQNNGLYMETCGHTQLKSLATALPTGIRNISYPISFVSSAMAAFQPFYAQDLQEKGGQVFGLNRVTRKLAYGNRKNLKSPHGMIVGHTGSGKSFFLKLTEISQTLTTSEDDLFVIDPQNEMKVVCEQDGGQFIDLTPHSGLYINPLEIPEDVFRSDDIGLRKRFVATQEKWLFSFCAAVMYNITVTQEHRSVLGRCLRAVYDRFFEKEKLDKQPTIVDVREELKNQMEQSYSDHVKDLLEPVVLSLEDYVEGSYDLFSKETSVNIHNRFIVFGLANVDDMLWEPAMLTIMHYLSARMEYNRSAQKATRLLVDEAQVVCEHESSANILLNAVVTFRKFGGMVTMCLQNIKRALEQPELRDMFSNCDFKYFLDSGGVDAAALAAVQKLSQTEFDSLTEEVPGYGVLVWGKRVYLIDSRMSKTNPMYKIFSTNFHEQAALPGTEKLEN